jgi:predicted nucleotidyltransferase component of viral defense system
MDAIKTMLETYKPADKQEAFTALREIMQNVVLLGLYRSNFFNKAAFYGGTALRILYGLDRFSEDMDFSLIHRDLNFDFTRYCKSLEKEIASLGFKVNIQLKKNEGQIRSAFLKADSKVQLLRIESENDIYKTINKQIKIRIEIDTVPPENFQLESRVVYKPTQFTVITFSKPSLFAGKMHAVLCRKWKNRLKGRDWYDLLWYIGERIPLDLRHLKSRMIQTGNFPADTELTSERLKVMLHNRIDNIDYEDAKKDVLPFIKDVKSLDVWERNFFHKVVEDILFQLQI